MMTINDFKKKFHALKGKTIAIVYIFENDNSSGFNHFFIWKGQVLTRWINAVYEIGCIPLIIDVREFVHKAMNKTLPHIDYVLNLNSGTTELSSMALVPSTCSSIGTPCIPCNAVAIVTGEDKRLSNYIADSIGLNVPRELNELDNVDKLFRPINLGNSVGVSKERNNNFKNGIWQEFITGYDITTPIVYNPISNQMELMPTVMFLPSEHDNNWFYGEKEKLSRSGYTMKVVAIDDNIKHHFLKLLQSLSIKTFCRIDSRVYSSENGYYHNTENNCVCFKDNFFVEINVMPTIREKNSFLFSYNSMDESSTLYTYRKALNEIIPESNINDFLLTSSLLSLS